MRRKSLLRRCRRSFPCKISTRMNFLSWLNFQRFFTQDFAAVQESIPAQVKKMSNFLAGTLSPVSIYKIPHVWADWTMMTTDDVALTTPNDCDDDRDPWGLRLIEFYSPHRVIQSDPHFCSVLCMRKYNDTVTPWMYLPVEENLRAFMWLSIYVCGWVRWQRWCVVTATERYHHFTIYIPTASGKLLGNSLSFSVKGKKSVTGKFWFSSLFFASLKPKNSHQPTRWWLEASSRVAFNFWEN